MKVNNNNSSKPYVITAGVAGGLGGAVYGYTHPSMKVCDKLEKMHPTIVENLQSFNDAFKLEAAKTALKEGKLDKKSFVILENISNMFIEIIKKEKEIKRIADTPYSQRVKPFKQAVKEANKLRPKLYKALFGLHKDVQSKLIKAGAFDLKQYAIATNEGKKKALKSFKLLSIGMLKFLPVGAAIGAIIGLGVHSLFNNNKHNDEN